MPVNADSYEHDTRRHYQSDSVAREYHEQFAAPLSLRNLTHVVVASAEQRAVGRLLASIRNDIVLVADVPCGTGKLIPVFHKLSLSALGGDVSAPMIRIARRLAHAAGGSMSFARLDITRLPFPDEAFDAVVCLRLLHRVPPDVRATALRELHRVTRRYAVVSYGIGTTWHALRQRLRALVSPGRTIPYPIPRITVDREFTDLGWRVARKLSPLPVISAEEIALLVKANAKAS